MMNNNNHKNSTIYSHHRNYVDLCQQYVIAGWLTSEQFRTVVVQPMEQMEELNEQEASIQMERIAEQIQYIISKAQEQKLYHNTKEEEEDEENMTPATTTASKSISIHRTTRHNQININQNQHHHVTWVDQQQQMNGSSTNKSKEDNSGIFTIPHEFYQKQQNSTFSIKELFVEMCFYARLGYIQPPCCLHCTYTDYYNSNVNKSNSSNQSDNSKKHKCTLPVVWRKDTSIVLHPDTIASNIMIVPCYIVREVLLLHHRQLKSKKDISAMIPIQHIIINGEGDSNDQVTTNSKSDQSLSRQYRYDPVNKIIRTA